MRTGDAAYAFFATPHRRPHPRCFFVNRKLDAGIIRSAPIGVPYYDRRLIARLRHSPVVRPLHGHDVGPLQQGLQEMQAPAAHADFSIWRRPALGITTRANLGRLNHAKLDHDGNVAGYAPRSGRDGADHGKRKMAGWTRRSNPVLINDAGNGIDRQCAGRPPSTARK